MIISLRLALRYVFSNKKQNFSNYASFLAIGGLSIGVASLMLTASIISGFEKIVIEKLDLIIGKGRITNIFNHSFNPNTDFRNTNISSLKPNQYVQGFSMLRYGNHAEGILVEGLEVLPNFINNFSSDSLNIGEIIVGQNILTKIGSEIGDIIYIQSFQKPYTNTNTKIKPFKIVNAFETGIQEYDDILVYVNINEARSLFNYPKNHISGFILTENVNANFENQVTYPYYFESSRDKHSLLFEWIKLQRWPAYIMFGLIALVGLINVLSALSMIIIEKSTQIGILKAQGMENIILRFIFIIQGGIISLFGSFFGGIIALIIILLQTKFMLLPIPSDIYFMDQIPFYFDFLTYLYITISVFIFSIFSSWLPTKYISELNPNKVLKYL
jgi:lipoprotein-releasing system permease protein